MSTRAIYTFKDDREEFHVYKHDDGYPEGALGFIEAATLRAWPLPRFEPDEFGAAFIAANKTSDGGVRLMATGPWRDVAAADIQYRYEITCQGDALHVAAFEVSCDWTRSENHGNHWTEKELYRGPMADTVAWLVDRAAADD